MKEISCYNPTTLPRKLYPGEQSVNLFKISKICILFVKQLTGTMSQDAVVAFVVVQRRKNHLQMLWSFASWKTLNLLHQRSTWMNHIWHSDMVSTRTLTSLLVSRECSSGFSCLLCRCSTSMVCMVPTSKTRSHSQSVDGSLVTLADQICSVNKWDCHSEKSTFVVHREQYLKLTRLFSAWYLMNSHPSFIATNKFWMESSRTKDIPIVPQTCHQTQDRPWEKSCLENAEERSIARSVSRMSLVPRYHKHIKHVMMSLTCTSNLHVSFHPKNWPLEKYMVSEFPALECWFTSLSMWLLNTLRVFSKMLMLNTMWKQLLLQITPWNSKSIQKCMNTSRKSI